VELRSSCAILTRSAIVEACHACEQQHQAHECGGQRWLAGWLAQLSTLGFSAFWTGVLYWFANAAESASAEIESADEAKAADD
jgi:hypothetical protein